MNVGPDVFGAISAPARREILEMLRSGPRPVNDIAENFSMSLSAVSQHLAILREANLVEIEKAGRQRIYKLTPNPLIAVLDWIQKYEQFWPDRLDRLGTYLERR